jgi:hypothetical protein
VAVVGLAASAHRPRPFSVVRLVRNALLVPEQTCEQPRPARLGRAPLIPIRQSVRRPSGEDASSVCVASPRGVALREDQHVLAQCGQMVSAERAAVRGGLQVLSRAHSPPARVRLALVAHAYIRSPPACSAEDPVGAFARVAKEAG